MVKFDRTALLHCVYAGITFSLIALYPVVSVLAFPPDVGIDASGFQKATASNIVQFLREAFPQVLLPLSKTGRILSDLQLGYALWGVLAVGWCGVEIGGIRR